MATIPLGIGVSHSPMLSMPPELWGQHGQGDWQHVDEPWEELRRERGPRVRQEITPEVFRARYDACQRALATLAATVEEVAPDALVVVGDDQREWFDEVNTPAVSIYWGDTVDTSPPPIEDEPTPALKAAYWGYYGDGRNETLPIAADLGRHLVESLVEQHFDIGYSRQQPAGRPFGHAWTFVYYRLLGRRRRIPMVPVMLNTYYPPSQPRPRRCYELGRAVRDAITRYDTNQKIAVVGSGGLSHFLVDEELDHRVIEALRAKDFDELCRLPLSKLNSGSSEVRNWIAAGSALDHLEMDLVDYVPCYRSDAGTGGGWAFAVWK
jgi:aromatic ring-opening dioxygenase catalytic subunit (LigB family)